MKRVSIFVALFFLLFSNLFAQKKAEYFKFLGDNLFNEQEFSPEFIEGELKNFIVTFPKDDTTGLALQMLYQINQRNGKYRRATFFLLKAASVFNQQLNLDDCIDKIRKNLYKKEGVFKKNIFEETQRQAVSDYLDHLKKQSISKNAAFQYLKLLRKIKSKKISDIYLHELDWYRSLFPGSRADTILCWKGDYYYDLGKFIRAAEIYQMILKLYANSPNAKRLYLRLADIYSKEKIWKYKEAADLLKTYLAKYKREEWLPAQIRLIQIDVEHLKNYDEAYEQFSKIFTPHSHIYLEEKIYYHLSNHFWDKGDLTKARFVYEQFKKQYPNSKKIKKFSIFKAENRKK